MKGDSTTTSSSSITTSNFPPITITLNSVNEDVAMNKMWRLGFKIPEKSNNNNNNNNDMVLHLIQHN